MIKNWLVTGDTHGAVGLRLHALKNNYVPEETAVIILGDAGINFYLNKMDAKNKRAINGMGFKVYCVRGNHEERPENLEYIVYEWDPEVEGYIIYEPNYPNIKYFQDGEFYKIAGHSTLVIGGAYSVDKYWRLERARYSGSSFTGWFPQEQLDADEMKEISEKVKGLHFDFIFSHTCPFSWMPTDLFLNCVDQSTVDNSMEHWMEELKDTFDWEVWLFGHFHDDRLVRPGVEMFYTDVDKLENCFSRWVTPSLITPTCNMDPKYGEGR